MTDRVCNGHLKARMAYGALLIGFEEAFYTSIFSSKAAKASQFSGLTL